MTTTLTSNRQPVVLLGASNLTIGWKPILKALAARIEQPIDVFVASGMGRSYVDWSTFAARRLPGIGHCGIWDSLRQHYPNSDVTPLVFITDIGNDLAYGRSPDNAMTALRECLTQLATWSDRCRIIVSGLPVESLDSLSRFRFLMARTLLFPMSSLQLSDVKRNSVLLNELVEEEVRQRNLMLAKPHASWYGVDPIHIVRKHRESAFNYYFDHWMNERPPVWQPFHAPSVSHRSAFIKRLPPLPTAETREAWGRVKTTAQPCFQDDRIRVFGF